MNRNKYCNAKNIKAELDDYVIGQEKGTRSIAMAVAQHIQQRDYHGPKDLLQTDNVLLIGPTGCGKTETFRVLKKLQYAFGCPVIMFNVLDYAATKSWQGESITNIFDDIIEQALNIYRARTKENENEETIKKKVTEIANHAIVLLDEFDKIALYGEGKNRSYLKEYQSNLLKIIEGNTYEVCTISYKRKLHIRNEDGSTETEIITLSDLKLDSTYMMFVFLGAFEGLQDITKNRLSQEKQSKTKNTTSKNYQGTHIGFMTSPRKNTMTKPCTEEYTYEQLIPTQEDIIQYGLMRELVGRIPIRTIYMPLSEDNLVNILLNSKTSAYKKYQERFKQNGHMLRCSRSALREIAHKCVERGTGARGMMTIFAELLQDTQYELSGYLCTTHCLLRGKEIRENKPPIIHDVTIIENRRWKKRFKNIYKKQKNN